MIIEQLFPSKSPTMTEGTLVAWRIKPGDQVKSGQVMAEIQSDKAVVEWECLDPGHVAEILIPAGTLAQVNSVAAIFTSKPGEDVKEAVTKAKAANAKLADGGAATAVPVAAPPASATASPNHQPSAISNPPSAPNPSSTSSTPPTLPKGARISPVAAKIAAANGLDLRQVKGSGPDGRIVRRDVEAAARAGTAKIGAGTARSEKPKLKPFRADGAAATDQPLSPMRAIIGKRLLEAKTQIPHFYIEETVDASGLVALREQLNQIDGVRITVNDLIVRATALALRMHPKVNATWHGTSVKLIDSADISIAVAIPDGLITPILTQAHAKGVRQISDEVRVLARKATDGKLQPAEFQGGSFTISNLGMYGIDRFSAIINPPQVAILAVGGIKDVPVVRGGQIVPGRTMGLTLSADHRAVDGADGAAFMKTLRELLEAPAVLLI